MSTSQLEPFIGTWTLTGQAYDSPFGKKSSIDGRQSYEWLPGGHFVINRLTGHLGAAPMDCIELIGADERHGAYPVHTYYASGQENDWTLAHDGADWLEQGAWPSDRGAMRVRNRIAFGDGGRYATSEWEYSADGNDWKRFWDLRLVRAS